MMEAAQGWCDQSGQKWDESIEKKKNRRSCILFFFVCF